MSDFFWTLDLPNVVIVKTAGVSAAFDWGDESDPVLICKKVNDEDETMFRKTSDLHPLKNEEDWQKYLSAKRQANLDWHKQEVERLTNDLP